MCWLSERLPDLPRWRLLLLRTVYRGVDGVLFYSPNQGALLHRYLGVPHHKLHAVRFGIDLHEFPVTGRARQPFALSVGRDRGRDWKTTFEAVRGTGIPLKVLCRPKELAGLEVPEEVQVLGYVARERYIELVQTCRVVLLLTHDLAYPTGQSVLLEAMAAETCCVVSQTAALQEYFGPGPTMLAAPVGDAAGARTQLLTAWDDDSLRTTIGRAAALDVRQRGSAQVMCAEMDAVLRIGGGPCE